MITEPKIAIIVSRFNQPITESLLRGALAEAEVLGISREQLSVHWVPGAIEIPLMVQHCARSKQFSAIVALGVVIQGETSHYDTVCQMVAYGCQRVSLDTHCPVVFGVLTTQTASQARARVGGNKGHKGREALQTAWEMIHLLSQSGVTSERLECEKV